MKMRLLYFAGAIVLAVVTTGFSNAHVNVNVRSPVGNPREVVSRPGRGTDLHRSPNPMAENGNLIITGNVAGGRHFRGPVPYRGRATFGGQMAYSPVESFLRRSGGDPYRFGYEPYRSRRSTVSILQPGTGGFLVLP